MQVANVIIPSTPARIEKKNEGWGMETCLSLGPRRNQARKEGAKIRKEKKWCTADPFQLPERYAVASTLVE